MRLAPAAIATSTPPKRREPPIATQVTGATLGGLALGLPALELGFHLGERYGPHLAGEAATTALSYIGKGWLSPQTAIHAAQYVMDPQVQRNLAGAVMGTVGLAAGVFLGLAVVEALSQSQA